MPNWVSQWLVISGPVDAMKDYFEKVERDQLKYQVENEMHHEVGSLVGASWTKCLFPEADPKDAYNMRGEIMSEIDYDGECDEWEIGCTTAWSPVYDDFVRYLSKHHPKLQVVRGYANEGGNAIYEDYGDYGVRDYYYLDIPDYNVYEEHCDTMEVMYTINKVFKKKFKTMKEVEKFIEDYNEDTETREPIYFEKYEHVA